MGNKVPIPARPPVMGNRTRICVAGFGISHNTGRAQKLAAAIATAHPAKYETWFYFSTFGYKDALPTFKKDIPADQQSKLSTLDKNSRTIATHKSSPFVWLEQSVSNNKEDHPKVVEALGGRDKFAEWASKEFPEDEPIQELSGLEEPVVAELFFDSTTPGGTWMENQPKD